jgi:ABC-type nitrate/sulfonate/bicarbonate transport system substrate-binding protein
MFKPRNCLAALVAGLMLATPPARAADLVRVGYAAQSFAFSGAVEAGLELGVFARSGLDVRPTTFGGGAKLHQAMLSGDEDIAMAAGSDFAFLVKGSPEKAVYGVVNAPYSVGLFVTDPAIRTPDDLKGRKIGVTTRGSYTFWFASQLPHFLNWSSGAVTPVSIGGSLANETAALTTGQVDGVVGDIVLGLMLQHESRGRTLLNGADLVHDVLTALVYAHNDLIAQRPDVLRRYLAGIRESVDYIISHRDFTIALTSRLNALPPEVMARYVDITNPGWSRDGHIAPEQFPATAEAIVQAGLLEAKPDLTPFYNSSFAPK